MADHEVNVKCNRSNNVLENDAFLMMLEPTPLSNTIDQRHMMNQLQQLRQEEEQQQQLRMLQLQQQQIQHQQLQQQQEQHNIRYLKEELCFDELGRSRMPNPKRRRGHPIGVRFNPDGYIHSNPRELDEIVDSWYSREDLAVFKAERKTIVKALKQVKFDLSRIDQSKHCLRGLEAYMSIAFNKLMQQKREQVMNIVLNEQARQKSMGVRPGDAAAEERLRQASCVATEWARDRAHELGMEDAKELGFTNVSPGLDEWGQDSMSNSIPSLCSSVLSECSPPIGGSRKSLDKSHPTQGLSTSNSPDALVRHFQLMKQFAYPANANSFSSTAYVSPTASTRFWSPTSPHAHLVVSQTACPPLATTTKSA